MKKFLSFVLALILLFTMLPVNVFATEKSSSEYDEIISLACEVFPEYAAAIRGDNATFYTQPRSMNNERIVHSETRYVSENRSLSISVLSSGNVILIDNESVYAELTYSSSNMTDISSVGISGTATFKVIVPNISDNEYFKLSGVDFTIYYTGSDYFSDTGTYAKTSNVSIAGTVVNSSTNIQYPLLFGYAPYYIDFRVYFENDKLVASIWL